MKDIQHSLVYFESEEKRFRGFLHAVFSRIFCVILCQISSSQHIDFTENIYRVLVKRSGHWVGSSGSGPRSGSFTTLDEGNSDPALDTKHFC
jgi:hypothetical protein